MAVQPASDDDKSASVGRTVQRLRENVFFLLAGILGTALIFTGQVSQGAKNLYEVFYPRPDSLALAREDSKDKISRDFVQTTWRRLYLSRNFLARIRRRAPPAEIGDAWTKLLNSVEEMNSKVMIYAVSFEEFYSTARRNEYENGIQVDFNRITNLIVDLRYSDPVKKLEFRAQPDDVLSGREAETVNQTINSISGELDTLQIRLYNFAVCFQKGRQTEQACQYGPLPANGESEEPTRNTAPRSR
jgi:hypothetical protein